VDLRIISDMWSYREVLYHLSWRDISVRYKQTVFGVMWAVFQPLSFVSIFWLFFGQLARQHDKTVPYPVFVLTGLLPWFFFSNAITGASQSLVAGQNLITKVYFPRMLMPLAAVAVALVDLAIALSMVVPTMACFGVWPAWKFLCVPLMLAALSLSAIGFGVLLAALVIRYRDFRHLVPFLAQLWMFATPCIYTEPELSLGTTLRRTLPLNPVYGFVLNFRAAVLNSDFDLYALSISSAVTVLILAFGCLYFAKAERSFADIV
jgi:lipopolysaccharide transport system permease protein